MNRETVWKFQVGRFAVYLDLIPEPGYQYDGDDPDGETQRKLDEGDYVAFGAIVSVSFMGTVIGEDSLWGSVYEAGKADEFWTAHRDPDPMNRNSSIMRAARGDNVAICHYFPGMVHEAVERAREFMREVNARAA